LAVGGDFNLAEIPLRQTGRGKNSKASSDQSFHAFHGSSPLE
jgi:hypothetical protein